MNDKEDIFGFNHNKENILNTPIKRRSYEINGFPFIKYNSCTNPTIKRRSIKLNSVTERGQKSGFGEVSEFDNRCVTEAGDYEVYWGDNNSDDLSSEDGGGDVILSLKDLERINTIRTQALLRSEKYSDEITNKSQLVLNNSFDINPNEERILENSQAFYFIKGEPLIIIGPDIGSYSWIFPLISVVSIIFYSMKPETFWYMKVLFIMGYLFFVSCYTLLMLCNPGIPKNKLSIELAELQRNYYQCNKCNCICYKHNILNTYHCNQCGFCVENFHHHCTFGTKCIGKGNKLLFYLWLVSIFVFLLVIFLFIMF